ncbi:MAG TPA: hypothetical protein VHF69_07765, partial [Candidatus Synoicihabitans sp.]|nr:hypothetical protein [Candidatus Synoicihabitans sp.]
MAASLPLLAITLGDPAGTGPELITRALSLPEIHALCRPLVVGDAATLDHARRYTGISLRVDAIDDVARATFGPDRLTVLDLKNVDLGQLALGKVSA